jgi:hypothetical protein
MPDFGNGRRTVDPLSDMNSGRRDRYGEAEDKIRDSGGVSKKSYGKMMEEAGRLEARDELAKMDSKMAPPRIFEPRCSVCKHPHRDWIESILVRGSISYKGIAERVTPSLDRRSISHHYKNHMDLQDAALIAIIEEEANLEGLDTEHAVRDIITKRGVLEIALRKGYEDILNGVTTVEPRDLIQIAKVLGDMDANAYETGLDELRSQVQIFIQAIKDTCDREMQAAIGQRVKELRKRENISGDFEKVMTAKPEIPEAVVVEH